MKSRLLLAASVAAASVLALPSAFAADDAKKPAAASKKAPAAKAAPKKAPVPAAEPAPAAAAEVAIPNPVATVDGDPITKEQLDAALAAMLAQQGATIDSIPPAQKPQLYRMMIDNVIVEHLVEKAAAGEEVPEEKVKAVIERVKSNFGSEEEMMARLKESGKTMEAVTGDIVRDLKIRQWLDKQVAGKVDVTDAEAADFYKNNPEQFKMSEQVRASHILLKLEPDASPKDVVAKKAEAAKIIERVKKGEDFAKLAGELSQDPSAKENQGDLDFFQKGQMVPEFSEAAFGMKKGDITQEPVRTQYGYHVIKVTDRKAAEDVTLETAKPKLMEFLERQKKDEEMSKIAGQLKAKADVKINLPPEEAPAAGLPPGAAPQAAPGAK